MGKNRYLFSTNLVSKLTRIQLFSEFNFKHAWKVIVVFTGSKESTKDRLIVLNNRCLVKNGVLLIRHIC